MADYAIRWKRTGGGTYLNPNGSSGLILIGAARTVSSASASGGVVTITTDSAHNYKVGQTVNITGVTPTGYNGKYVVRSVPTTTTFTVNGTGTGTVTVTGTATPTTEFLIDAASSTSETPTAGVEYEINVANVYSGSLGSWSLTSANSTVTPYAETTTTPTGTATTLQTATATNSGSDTITRVSYSSGWSGIIVQTSNASWVSMTVTYSLLGVSKSVTVLKANVSDKNTVYFTIPKSVALTVSVTYQGNGNNFSYSLAAV